MRHFYGTGVVDVGKGSKAININYIRPQGTNINGYQGSLQLWGTHNDGYSANGMAKIGWGWAW